ncbi:hypothetical protein Droror1_Dr00006132 [Drosera rotundifolia]
MASVENQRFGSVSGSDLVGQDYGSCASSSSSLSSASSSSTSLLDGPLYGLSELMEQLPIKKGLSAFYAGKSESFTSLVNVKSVNDLAKTDPIYRRHRRRRRRTGMNVRSITPKATIAKKRKGSGSSGALPIMFANVM